MASPIEARSPIRSFRKTRPRMAIQIGTVAMKIAAGPLGRYCSPQLRAPLPIATSPVPVRTADSHWRALGQPPASPPRSATRVKSSPPASR